MDFSARESIRPLRPLTEKELRWGRGVIGAGGRVGILNRP
jgi:hypothetical protein